MLNKLTFLLALTAILALTGVSCGDERQPDQTAAPETIRETVSPPTTDEARPSPPELEAAIAALSDQVSALRETNEQIQEDLDALRLLSEAQQGLFDRLARELDAVRAVPRELVAEAVFTLQLLHASDMDGAVGALGNVENFSAILDGFRRQFPHSTLVLSSGDNYIPGPRYYAAADEANDPVLGVSGAGRGDVALLNAMGFQASALGNHELDRGTSAFASTVRAEQTASGTYTGTLFPYLSSNLDFSGDDSLRELMVAGGQESFLVAGSLAESAVINLGGQRVGIVGATTPSLSQIAPTGGISVEPEDDSDLDTLALAIQQAVDRLRGQGIDKVILLAHMQQIGIEQVLAGSLVGVDIIVAGGSNTILADDNDRLRAGDRADHTYPLLLESRTGEPVLLVNTDGDYRYLGRLVVGFDSRGVVLPDTVDPYVSGAYATDPQGGQAFAGRPIAEVSRIVDSLRNVLRSRDGNILGRTSVYLAGSRNDVRTQETNLGNLAADANLWLARQVDPAVAVSVKNAGGIRDDIGLVLQPPGTTDPLAVVYRPPPPNPDAGKKEGDITQFDIEGVLRFNNGLVVVSLTAGQLVELMEHSVGFDEVGKLAGGRFPQVAGMRFSFDPSLPSGQRVRSLAVVDDGGTVTDRIVESGALSGDPARRIKLVTLDFLANGGDSYPFAVPDSSRIDLSGEAGQFSAPDPEFPDTNGNGEIDGPALSGPGLADFAEPGTEQDALAEYIAHFYSETPFNLAETGPEDDRRIQNLGLPGKRDTVFDAATP